MTFISFEFIILLLAVFVTYFTIPQRFRWVLLLGASYYFYGYWNPNYLVLIVFSTLVDYLVARRLETLSIKDRRRRKFFLLISIITNLSVLFFFKYFNFFNASFADMLGTFGITASPIVLDVLLPVGISFYTFQSMAYTIDVYRGKISAERHLGIFATDIAFFPQLVAGPIERAGNILPQLRLKHDVDMHRITLGLRLILWGVFKKVVIADRIIIYINDVFSNYEQYTGIPIILAAFMVLIFIYCDFSAYSDIAIGSARLLGIDLMINFRSALFATSIADVWRRWHISLITWFRDYLYFPLGGSRKGFYRTLLNIMIVFLVSGLWHGAGWNFVVWGAYYGVLIIIERVFNLLAQSRPILKLIVPPPGIRIILVIMARLIAEILFWSPTLEHAGHMLVRMFNFSTSHDILQPFSESILAPSVEFTIFIVGLIIVLIYDYFDWTEPTVNRLDRIRLPLRWGIYYTLIIAIILSLVFKDATEQFVYFQF